jgi:hypothetical protein
LVSHFEECSQGVTLNFEFLSEYQAFVVYDVEFIWFYFVRNVSQGVTLSSFVGIKLMLYMLKSPFGLTFWGMFTRCYFEFLNGYQTYIVYVIKFIWSHILKNVHKVLFWTLIFSHVMSFSFYHTWHRVHLVLHFEECLQGASLNFEFIRGYQTSTIYDAKFIWFDILRNVQKVLLWTLSSLMGVKSISYMMKSSFGTTFWEMFTNCCFELWVH